jgi:MYXO-CTERM domain-containing protein
MKNRLVGASLLVAACAFAASQSAAQPLTRPITTYIRVPTPSAEEIAEMHAQMAMGGIDAAWVIYLNPNGGTFDPGWPDDSQLNRSSVLSSTLGRSATIPAYPYGDASWQQVLTCVRDLYADFDVYVTDEDPGATPHMETVVGGSPGDIGLPWGVGGIAPSGCEPVPNSVQYVFPETYGAGGEQGICEAAGQETAHSFGLDHEYYCPDVMTYLYDCYVNKTFVDESHPCGEYGPRGCSCGNAQQNSYRWLMDTIGPHQASSPPSVTITNPEDGDTVAQGFDVTVNASDDGAITQVTLLVDGNEVDVADAAPWDTVAPADITAGDHTVEVRALDDAGEEASDTISVTVSSMAGGECGPLDPCPSGQSCVDGNCLDDGTDGSSGDSGGSGLDGKVGFDGGGCAVGPGRMSPGAIFFLAIVAVVLLVRRRR